MASGGSIFSPQCLVSLEMYPTSVLGIAEWVKHIHEQSSAIMDINGSGGKAVRFICLIGFVSQTPNI